MHPAMPVDLNTLYSVGQSYSALSEAPSVSITKQDHLLISSVERKPSGLLCLRIFEHKKT